MERKSYVTEIRVPWCDVDSADVVYFPHFIRYFEVGEAELFRALGKPRREFYRGYNLVLLRVEAFCKFLAPATEDDLLEVHTRVEEVRSKGYRLGYEIRRKGEGTLLATGHMSCVCARRGEDGFRAIPLPEELEKLLKGALSSPGIPP
ncbi:MAG: acyl-CoA thioesterase [Acidobacteria bacterium]|nr:acyl-CoA thioesterase [Acidobacteriota bacterium]